MTYAQHDHHDTHSSWEHIGRAAEHFARRVARDASRFAERMEEHAGDFARDAGRDWRRARRDLRHGCGRAWRASEPEVRSIFEDIRTVLADVLEGVDELIAGMFNEAAEPGEHQASGDAPPSAGAEGGWVRIVHNRDAVCTGCTRTMAAGDEGFVRRTAEGVEFRCQACGVPSSTR